MRTDYKTPRIIQDENTTKVLARFYEGNITTENEQVNGINTNVTRYRRASKTGEKEYTYQGKTITEIKGLLNKELVSEPIDEQKPI